MHRLQRSFPEIKFLVLTIVLAFACPMILATADAAPGQTKQNVVPKSLAGLKMKFKDLHGDYVCSFAKDGTFSFASRHNENSKPEVRKGRYQWHVKGTHNALLDLGEDEIYKLTFNSPNQATGQAKGDVRTYAFTFAK